MQCLGRNSLIVYWVHLMLVYGNRTKRFHAGLGISATSIAALLVIALMVGLSVVWPEIKKRYAAARGAAA
jgi:fucose 4-O-acetylase-like acetyltransferase